MDKTLLLSTLPDCVNQNIYLLFEAGAQSRESFQAFHAQSTSNLYSLYLHPQLTEFQLYGPWLLRVNNKTQLARFTDEIPGCTGVVLSHRHLSSLAIQLSRGCTIVAPDGTTALVRFYARHVIDVLAQAGEQDWHAFLFRDITQWWVPGERQWQRLFITAAGETLANPIIHLDQKSWQDISDPPLIGNILQQWQKMSAARHFPPCTQRAMVLKAVKKAQSAGLSSPQDQTLYAFYYLSGGKVLLESELLDPLLHQVNRGEKGLRDALKHLSAKLKN